LHYSLTLISSKVDIADPLTSLRAAQRGAYVGHLARQETPPR